MIQIDDVVISLDVFREKFLCNLDACKGECCIEGDAGAPVELDEVEKLEEVLPVIWEELSPEARAVIDKQGDSENEKYTQIKVFIGSGGCSLLGLHHGRMPKGGYRQ